MHTVLIPPLQVARYAIISDRYLSGILIINISEYAAQFYEVGNRPLRYRSNV